MDFEWTYALMQTGDVWTADWDDIWVIDWDDKN